MKSARNDVNAKGEQDRVAPGLAADALAAGGAELVGGLLVAIGR